MLGDVLYSQNRRMEARKIAEEDLAATRRDLGPAHPLTIGSMRALLTDLINCATLYDDPTEFIGRIDPRTHEWLLQQRDADTDHAVRLGEEALEISRRVLGPDHACTQSLAILSARAYGNAGKWDQALEKAQITLETSRRGKGEESNQTLLAMDSVSWALSRLDRHQECIPLDEHMFEVSGRRSGATHSRTLTAASQLVVSYLNVQRFEDAQKLCEQQLQLCRQRFGPDHEWTRDFLELLTTVHRWTQKLDKLCAAQNELVAANERALGPNHSHTNESRVQLAAFLRFSNQPEEARALMDRQVELFGDNVDLLNDLAWALATAKPPEWRDGEFAVQAAIKACKLSGYDANNIDTLAAAYAEMGDFDSAVKFAQMACDKEPSETEFADHLQSFKQEKPWRNVTNISNVLDREATLLSPH